MTLRENVTAVIESCFSEAKEEIQEIAINRIMQLVHSVDTPQTQKTCENCGQDKSLCKYCIEEDRMWIPFKGLADDDDGTLPQTEERCEKCVHFMTNDMGKIWCIGKKTCERFKPRSVIPQTDERSKQMDIYPLVIIKDRYTGVYSGGKYTAWNMDLEDIPQDIEEDDVSCHDFWFSYDGVVGLGKTPNEAAEDLHRKLERERKERWRK